MAVISLFAPPQRGPVRETFAAMRHFLSAAFMFSLVMSLLALTTSFYMLEVYDRVLASHSVDTLLLITVIAAIAMFAFGWLDSVRTQLLSRIAMRIGNALGGRVLRAMVASSSQSGLPAARSGLRDVETVRTFVGSPPFAALMDAPFALVFLAVLYLLHPMFVVVVLGGGAVLALLAFSSQKSTSGPLTQGIAASMRAMNFAEDGLRNADVLEGMGMSTTFAGRWHDKWIDSIRMGALAGEREARLAAASKATRYFIQIMLFATGAILILNFSASGGIMIAASIIGSRALQPIEAIVTSWKTLIAVRQAWQRIDELLARTPKREQGMPLPAPRGQISAIGVGCVAAGRPILRNLSFELAAGESLGVIGPSGSGKSSLLRLLVGAWPCSVGVIRLDGANVYSWPREDIGRYIGYLPQDVELFGGTVRENIARMGPDDPEAIALAAQRAGAHEMILSLPNGYDTEIGPQGQRLSGGQAQRIGIARALYREPRLIALDEPNSNLDGQGENALVAMLAELKNKGVTVIVVAHRASILRGVDKILALQNGALEAFGPRDAVLQHFIKRSQPRVSDDENEFKRAEP